MPRGDGTGPMGMGSMTGRAMGYCAGYSVPGYMNQAGFGFSGRGFGFAGRGRGHRNMFYATGLPGWMRFGYSPGWGGGLGPCAQFLMTGQWPTPQMAAAWEAMQTGQPPMAMPGAMGPWMPGPEAQLQMLKSQADMLEAQLEQLREAIAQMQDQETPEG